MFAEWFYPKGLKKIIADLVAEENLHRKPLEELNKGLMLMFYITIIITVAAVYSEGFLSGASMFMIMICLLFLHGYLNYCKFKVYIYGVATSGIIDKVTCYCKRGTIIEIIRECDGCIIKTANIHKAGGLKHNINIGQKLQFFEIDSKWIRPMPDIREINEIYCLRKDLMEKQSIEQKSAINPLGERAS